MAPVPNKCITLGLNISCQTWIKNRNERLIQSNENWQLVSLNTRFSPICSVLEFFFSFSSEKLIIHIAA